ncbi:TIGR02117 family protein [Aquibium microcysteis]|uniref:TIGR02117 family protein n=1 Tax=Aquibium microcysteis TaxID=675281 RepID=UPI00165D2701|nr:TIGR02117 family protein [Aquibium microcysteis]
MRRLLRRGLRVLAVAIVAVAAGVLVPRPMLPAPQAAGTGEGPRRTVLLLSNPIHTDIALPADPDIRARFAALAADGLPIGDPAVRWLVVGWGGRSFYVETPTWADLKPLPVLRAFTLDRSVMHVAVAGDIPLSHPAVTALALDAAGFEALLDHVEASFVAPDGRFRLVAPGYGAHDRFYEAHGWFNALAGCNVWTAAALRAAGIRTGAWTPLPVFLGWSLALHG